MNDINPKNTESGRKPSMDMRLQPKVEVRHSPGYQPKATKKSSPWLKRILVLLVLGILILGGFVVLRVSNISSAIFVGQKTTFYDKLKDIIQGTVGGAKLSGEDTGQINILILGMGGEGHDGPYLTDTMMLAQIRPDIKQISLTSIPRDYLVSIPGMGQRKINAAFAEGYNQSKDFATGGLWAQQAVEKISGLQVPYFGVLDFKGFEQAIDLIGGVDVEIENTFTDYTFPNDTNYGYLAPVTFTAGPEHMNGKRALIFARSRHAAGNEGSDFARSQRQQKVIDAFKVKITSLNLISDPNKISQLISVLSEHVHTNISPGQMFRLYSLLKDYSSSNTISLSLDPSTRLICPQILESNGAYVLSPCAGKTNDDIKNFFKDSFAVGRLYKEKSIVWLADSAKNAKNYAAAEKELVAAGLTVYKVGFTGEPLAQNVVYQVNSKPATAEYIRNNLEATEASVPPPGIKIDSKKVDVILILGE